MPPLLSHLHSLRNPRYTFPILIVTLTALATRTFLLEPHPVAGPSMAPALNPSYNPDTILVLKRDPLRPWEPTRTSVRRGDVVVFWKPGAPEEMGVKRVLGVEGDTVYRDFRRAGKRREGAVGSFGERLGMGEVGTVIKVPVGHVWVEGDNWRESLDSNDFGPVSFEIVVKGMERVRHADVT